MSTLKTRVGNYRDFRDVNSRSDGATGADRGNRQPLGSTSNSLEGSSEIPVSSRGYLFFDGGFEKLAHKELLLTNLIGHYVASSQAACWAKLLKRCSSRIYVGTCSAEVTTTVPVSDFDLLREKILEYLSLSPGWDSYDADPPSQAAVNSACSVVDCLEKFGLLPEWVVPTSDSSVLMSAKVRGTELKWEFDSDGDIAVMQKPKFSPATYHDLQLIEIGSFLEENLRQG